MEATNSLKPRLPWAGKSVNLENVEEELSLLWKISADNMRTGQNTQVRTSILNLVICDSTSFFNPEQDILTLSLLHQSSPDYALSDLNWGRITSWRELVVQFFDVTEYRPYLSGITSIEIEHAAAPLASPIRTELGD